MIDLARLEDVHVREAWASEEHGFTHWMAENLDRLAEVLGIPLELTGREVQVGGFEADLLARNPLDDTVVLIENQLQQSDHSHLGQILTYLAGLEAEVVVWVAPGFREPHLSAIRWLNAHTHGDLSFFAVRVRVVRIANSPLAPVFEVLERPSDWDRTLHAMVAPSGEMSELGRFRLDFWTRYLQSYPAEAAHGAASGLSWRGVEVPGTGLVVVQYLGSRSVGVFIRGPRGSDRAETGAALVEFEEPLMEALGVDLDPTSQFFFVQWTWLDTRDTSTWPAAMEWLHQKGEEYREAIDRIVPATGAVRTGS